MMKLSRQSRPRLLIEVLIESREKLLDEHETTVENQRQNVDNQIEGIRQAIDEKEREFARTQQEDVNKLDEERERLSEVVNESASQSRERENKIQEKKIEWWGSVMENQKLKKQVESLLSKINKMNKDLNKNTNRVSELELELETVKEHGESLTSQEGCLKLLTEE